jgi:hypothetical protein
MRSAPVGRAVPGATARHTGANATPQTQFKSTAIWNRHVDDGTELWFASRSNFDEHRRVLLLLQSLFSKVECRNSQFVATPERQDASTAGPPPIYKLPPASSGWEWSIPDPAESDKHAGSGEGGVQRTLANQPEAGDI